MFGVGYCSGMSAAGWVLMVGFWLAVIALVVWAVARLFPSGGRHWDIEAELDRRLAAGELDPTTYRQLRTAQPNHGRGRARPGVGVRRPRPRP